MDELGAALQRLSDGSVTALTSMKRKTSVDRMDELSMKVLMIICMPWLLLPSWRESR